MVPCREADSQQGDGGEISTFADSEGAGAIYFLLSRSLLSSIHKGVDVFELPVDRGKANIGHLVQSLSAFP